jgi:beta-glucosidase
VLAPGGSLQVSVDVENTGRNSGKEVVQLYIHQRAGSASRPRELKGFQRTLLAPGEKKTVQFTLGKDELSFWSPEAKLGGGIRRV